MLGDAFVVISPDSAGFRTLADAQIRRALAGIKPEIPVGLDVQGATAAMRALQTKIRQLGLADFLDVNLPPGRIQSQLQLLKRLMSQAKLSDVLDVNLNRDQLDKQLSELSRVTATIPINFDIAKLPVPADIGKLTEKVQVVADAGQAISVIEGLKARLSALSHTLSDLRIEADDKDAEAKIAGLQAKLLALTKLISKITIGADTSKIDAALATEQAKLAKLVQQSSDLKLNADTTGAAAKIAALEAQAFHLEKSLDKLTADVDINAAITKIYAIEAQLKVLTSNAENVRIAADITAVTAAIAAVKANIATLTTQANDVKFNIDTQGLAAAEAQMLGLEAATAKLAPTISTGDAALGAFARSITGAGRGWGILTGRIALFGGALGRVLPLALTGVSVWHAAADAIIEFGAVVIPASLALIAFGIAGADAAVAIQRRMQAVHTVMDATGQAVPPLTNAMENLHKAVQPQVYQLFGDALTIMNSKTGLFQTVAKGTATVVDQLAARFTFAATQGGGFTQFMRHSVTDVGQLGTVIGNIGGIFGNVFKVVPGYANILLSLGVAFTSVIENVTRVIEPVTKWVLILHGAIVYTGLFVTGTLALVGAVANLARAFFTFAAGSVLAGVGALKTFGSVLVSIGLAIAAYIEEIIVADGASASFAAALAPLAANPMFWVAAAAAALGVLAFTLLRSKDAAQQFNQSMQQTIASAQLSSVITTIQQAQAATALKLADATHQVNQAVAAQAPAVQGAASRFQSGYNPALDRAVQLQQHYHDGASQLSDQLQLVTGRVSSLATKYGSNTAALGALNAAGITTAQITDKNNQHWAQALIQVNSTTQAYTAMGTQAGQLGNDLDVLGRTVTDQYQAIQKLNQGWSTFIKDVTGTQTSFDTFAAGLDVLSSNASTFTERLGRITVRGAITKTAIDDLSASGIALNQAFSQQITNMDAMTASWRTAGLANNLFKQGIALAIAPLEVYAAGSKQATAQLIAMGQQAGYQGPISLQALNKYLGITSGMLQNTAGDTQGLKDIANQATTQEALLTGAMKSQGDQIANQLLGDLNQAIIKYSGVEAAVRAYGKAVAESGASSDAAKQAMTNAVDAIVKSEKAMGDNTSQMAAVVAKTFSVDMPTAMAMVKQAMLDNQSTSQKTTASISGDFGNQATAASKAKTDLTNYSKAIQENGVNSSQAQSARAQLIKDLTDAGVNAHTADADVANYTKQVLANGSTSSQAAGARAQLIKDILGASTNAVQGQKDLSTYNNYILANQQTTDAGKAARAALIQDLINSGVKASTATALVNGLSSAVGALPTGKTVNLYAVAHGSGNIVYKETFPGGSLQGALLYGRTGMKVPGGGDPGSNLPWKIPGWGGGDKIMAMLEAGETVVPKHLTPLVAGLMKKHNVPGFLGGGLVGNYGKPSDDMGLIDLSYLYKVQSGVDAKMQELLKSKVHGAIQQGIGLGGVGSSPARTGSVAVEQAYAASLMTRYGWSAAAQMPSLIALWNQESSWDPYAVNKSSGAYGIPQSLGHGHPYNLGDYQNQIIWGLNYIRSIYGSPAAAEQHERAFNWYGLGGLVPGFASGGLAGSLAKGQAGEQAAYTSLARGLTASTAHPRAGSFLATHRKTILSELATLAKRQTLETSRYRNLSGTGLTTAHLAEFSTALREEARTAADKDLSSGAPTLDRALQSWLSTLEATAGGGAPAGKTAKKTAAKKTAAVGGKTVPSHLGGPLTAAQYHADLAEVAGLSMAAIRRSPHLTHIWHLLHLEHLAARGLSGGGLVARSFDSGNVMPPGYSMSYNGTGRPEPLVPTGGGSGRGATLDDVVQALNVATAVIAQQGQQFASALNSSANAAASRGSYSNRRL